MGACEFVTSLMLGRVELLIGNGLIPFPVICGLISCCKLLRHIIGCFLFADGCMLYAILFNA